MFLRKIKKISIIIILALIVTILWRWFVYPATYLVNNIDEVDKIVISNQQKNITLCRHVNGQWTINHTPVCIEKTDDFLFLLQNLVPRSKIDSFTDTTTIFEVITYNGIFPLSKFSITSKNKQTFVKPQSPFSTAWYSVELLNHQNIFPIELVSIEPSFWIEKVIFDDPQKIIAIKVSHFLDNHHSFSLSLSDKTLFSTIKDSTTFYQYLSYFSNLSVDHYISDTVINTSPIYGIEIFTATDTTNIRLYDHPANKFKGYFKSNRQPYVGMISWNIFDVLLFPDFLLSVKENKHDQ